MPESVPFLRELRMAFGKYVGRTLGWIADHDQDYVMWAAGQMNPRKWRTRFRELLAPGNVPLVRLR